MIRPGFPWRAAPYLTALSSLLFLGCPSSLQTEGSDGSSASEVICKIDADCPPPASSPCSIATCLKGVCGLTPAAAGPRVTLRQQPRDCQRVECDGKGGTVNVPDDSDLPNDSRPCTEDTCSQGIPRNACVTRDVPVTGCEGDRACDGAGSCLARTFASCRGPGECVSGACYSVSTNGDGVCKKAVGEVCADAEECISNVCDQNKRCAHCDQNQSCTDGSCISDACFKTCTPACAAGYTCSGGKICMNDCLNSSCPADADCINSICVPHSE